MRAVLCREFGPVEQLRIEEVAAPVPGLGQVLIDVRASALNFPDALIVQGRYQIKPPFPFSPGAEASGIVRAVGPGVTSVVPGTAVVAPTTYGALAEQCLADERLLTALPPGIDFDSAAALVMTYGTSLHALRTCGELRAGESVLVLGAAGGVGMAAIQIAKALGARVIAAASSDARLALCRQAGADETLNYTTQDLRKAIEALTRGTGVDVVCDPVGGAYTEAALRSTAWLGRYLVIGFAAGEIPRIPLNLALLKQRRIVGILWGEAMRKDPAQHQANMRLLFDWLASGRISPMISARVALAQAIDAIERIARRQVVGKVVVQFASTSDS